MFKANAADREQRISASEVQRGKQYADYTLIDWFGTFFCSVISLLQKENPYELHQRAPCPLAYGSVIQWEILIEGGKLEFGVEREVLVKNWWCFCRGSFQISLSLSLSLPFAFSDLSLTHSLSPLPFQLRLEMSLSFLSTRVNFFPLDYPKPDLTFENSLYQMFLNP